MLKCYFRKGHNLATFPQVYSFPDLCGERPSLCDGAAVGAEEEGQRRRVRLGVAERGQVRVIVA